MDQIVLFGDSLTEFAVDQTRGFSFNAAIQNEYIRRIDVVNRGYSGYNTVLALRILPHLIQAPSAGRIRLFSIFLGANDARLPNSGTPAQHVPRDQYKTNLARILDCEQLKPHAPRFVLITPPPLDERLCVQTDSNKGYGAEKRRTAATTAAYAQTVRDLGRERGVPVVDLWTALMQAAGWDGDEKRMLHDGLHFNGVVYEILHKEWMKTVTTAYPDMAPDKLPHVFPIWSNEEAWNKFEGPKRIL
ncbi:hypothetical protein ANO11243_052670 [Dothideomycetidae sp. 11243]|nr:hypothetical protein ANO11243_052670 [fungal sp. No.11243]